MVNSPGQRTNRLRRQRPVTVHDRMSYTSSNHGLQYPGTTCSGLSYGSSSLATLSGCAPRINARTGGYDIPLPFEEDDERGVDLSTTTFVTDSTVKVDNTTTNTSKEFLRYRMSGRRQRQKGIERSSSGRSSNFWRMDSFDSEVIDRKLRTRVPQLLQGRLRRFNLIRKLEASGRTELVSEEEDEDDSQEEDDVMSIRPRQCFVLPDEAPLPSTPIRKPFLAQRNRTVSSTDSEGFEVVTQGDDAASAMIVNSSSAHVRAGTDDTTEESEVEDDMTCLSGVGSSMVSDSRLMNASEPGALRLTTGSLQHHDERFGMKTKSAPLMPLQRQRRLFPFLRKGGDHATAPPMDSEEQQRIERKRQQYLAQQRERELARVSKEQRDRVFNSIIGKSAAERQDILKDILDEAKARKRYTLNCSGYAPHMDRSTSIATSAIQCGVAECSAAPPVFQFE